MAVQDELTCQELVELITEYLEGMLQPAERGRFEQHLVGCRGCRNYLEQMRRTIRLVGRLTENDVSPEARQVLLATFRDWRFNGNRAER